MFSNGQNSVRITQGKYDSTEDGKENDDESGNMPGLACMADNSSLPVKIGVTGCECFDCINVLVKTTKLYQSTG